MNAQFFIIGLAALLIAVSVFFGLKVFGIYRRKTASASWSATTGNVLSRNISSIKNSSSGGYSYRADVTYRYDAPGGPFEKKLFLGSKGFRPQAEKLLETIGETIQVRYNPERPVEHITDLEKIMPVHVFAMIGSLILAVVLLVLAFL
jgi:hypothetical protein